MRGSCGAQVFRPVALPFAPLDQLLDTKSTDRKMTLLHFIALTVKEKYPDLANFWHELHFVEKAAAVSLENVLLDVKELGRGMELIRRECSIHDNSVLRNFLSTNEGKLDKLQRDAKTAEEAYNAVVRYFGESPKTTPPSVFFPVFVRFIRSYKEAEQENEARKKQEEVMREKQLAQEAKKLDAKTPSQRNKWQQQELIAELRRRQAKEHRPVYEGKDGTIEDIITGGPFALPDAWPLGGSQTPPIALWASSHPTPMGPDHCVSLLGHSAEECPFHGSYCQAGLTLLL